MSGTLTRAGLERLWTSNGGNPAAARMAAAIALAESSGNQYATDHDSNGTVDRGYWQINSVHGALSTFGPDANAKAAIAISANGTNWGPWSTFASGAYKPFLSGGAAASTSTSAPSSGASTSTSTSSSGGLGHDMERLLLTAALVALGGGLAYAGVRQMTGGALPSAAAAAKKGAEAGALA